jgi:hypothetical protein
MALASRHSDLARLRWFAIWKRGPGGGRQSDAVIAVKPLVLGRAIMKRAGIANCRISGGARLASVMLNRALAFLV